MSYAKGKKPATASTNGRDEAKAANILTRRKNRGTGNLVSWGDASPELLLGAVVACTDHGVSIQLSYTRAGDALVIRLYDGRENLTDYVRPTESIDDYLTGLAADLAK